MNPCRLLAVLFSLALPAGAANFSHAGFDRLLHEVVEAAGRVDYSLLLKYRNAMDAYLDSLGRCSPRNQPQRFATPAHEMAKWINAYNALVLRRGGQRVSGGPGR